MKNGIIHIAFANVTFNCPHCKKEYKDEDDFYIERINKNKKGYTTHKCDCSVKFGITYNFRGDMVGFNLQKL
jgi:transposase-like protein